MSYQVNEIFLSLQGEGARTGRPAVFLRFSGCNLWSGREEDRASAICKFCDTSFVGTNGAGGGKFDRAEDLARAVAGKWPADGPNSPYVVCTGGEPLLQLDKALIMALHREGFEIAIETNGTLPIPAGVDWSCVSPKADAEFVAKSGDELKLVYPQIGAEPERYEGLSFANFFLQPMDGPELRKNMAAAAEYCIAHPNGASAFKHINSLVYLDRSALDGTLRACQSPGHVQVDSGNYAEIWIRFRAFSPRRWRGEPAHARS